MDQNKKWIIIQKMDQNTKIDENPIMDEIQKMEENTKNWIKIQKL